VEPSDSASDGPGTPAIGWLLTGVAWTGLNLTALVGWKFQRAHHGLAGAVSFGSAVPAEFHCGAQEDGA
jgi:hypothetical protein